MCIAVVALNLIWYHGYTSIVSIVMLQLPSPGVAYSREGGQVVCPSSCDAEPSELGINLFLV